MSNTILDDELSHQCQAIITDSQRISPESSDEVRLLSLKIDDPAFRFSEGQTIGILLPSPLEFSKRPHHRYYSIASARDLDAKNEIKIEIETFARIGAPPS